MRKLTCHFYLMPDGHLGKRPIIQVSDAGEILDIRIQQDSFKEEPGTEYYGGIIIPAFIEDLRGTTFFELTPENQTSLLNRFYINGSLRIITDDNSSALPGAYRGQSFHLPDKASTLNQSIPSFSTWEMLKNASIEDPATEIIASINNHFQTHRERMPEKLGIGKIEPGAHPGLLLIKGMSVISRRLTTKTSIKILVK